MVQLLVAVLVTIALVLFSMSNSHDVELDCIIGNPIQIRLIVLLTITFFAGGVAAYLYHLTLRVFRQRAQRSAHWRSSSMELDEEDEF